MQGIHILSSAPSGDAFRPAYFETVSMILSALLWKKFNGKIHLYTDQRWGQFIDRLGLSSIWDQINTQALTSLPKDIDWSIFWAGSKFFALQEENSPVAMLDTDLFVWKNLDDICGQNKVVSLHREDLIDCYLPKGRLPIAKDYLFPKDLDWSIKPCNTAFAYFADNDFKNLYVQEAIRFMRGNNRKINDGNARMVFAEQRLLAMLADREGVDVGTVIDDPFSTDNKIFTHLWGSKILARKNPIQRVRLEDAMLREIRILSPDAYDILSRMDKF